MKKIIFLIGMLVVFSEGLAVEKTKCYQDNPENAVYSFYHALSEDDCKCVSLIRPFYSKKRCYRIKNAIPLIVAVKRDIYMARVFIRLNYIWNNKKMKTQGIVFLNLRSDKWIISKFKKLKLIPQEFMKSSLEVMVPIENPYYFNSKKKLFGSEKILKLCWNNQELKGGGADKKIFNPFINNINMLPPKKLRPNSKLPHLPSTLIDSIRRFKPHENKKIIALTFDLCESIFEKTGYDFSIINYLRKHNIKATFYAGGKWMRSHPEKTKQLITEPLFEIGNHSWSHANFAAINLESMEDEILWTQAQYEILRKEVDLDYKKHHFSKKKWESEMSKIPLIPLTFRFPFGSCSDKALYLLQELGLPAIQWDIVTADPWKKRTAQDIASIIKSKVRPGSIIIAHANGRGHYTSDSLPLFIPALQSQGYQFVTITELINNSEAVYSTSECFREEPGDLLKYNKNFVK